MWESVEKNLNFVVSEILSRESYLLTCSQSILYLNSLFKISEKKANKPAGSPTRLSQLNGRPKKPGNQIQLD